MNVEISNQLYNEIQSGLKAYGGDSTLETRRRLRKAFLGMAEKDPDGYIADADWVSETEEEAKINELPRSSGLRGDPQ